ncbi:chitin synthase-domain-containing protein [Lipomyces japonicus]|uniref:chitin synthase-domain-containing protein n=1 Tax=Lipomyces japonicus TaxID=56871 RepID=UPI0034CED4C4
MSSPLMPSEEQGQSNGASDFRRKRSLIRPERSRITKDHPNYYYAQHAQNMPVLPSTTGIDPSSFENNNNIINNTQTDAAGESGGAINAATAAAGAGGAVNYVDDPKFSPSAKTSSSISDDAPSGSDSVSKQSNARVNTPRPKPPGALPKPPSFWQVYCSIITFWAPGKVLSWCGMPAKARQNAWREKMGLITVILYIGAFVGFLTFGFTEAVCSRSQVRLRSNSVDSGNMIIHGRAYDLTRSQHPLANGIPARSNVLYSPINAGGQDGSFLFQNVNHHCKGLFVPTEDSTIPYDSDGNMAWYFPCKTFNQDGSSTPNFTWPYYTGYACHTSSVARNAYYNLRITGDVYFTWDDIRNASRNLVVYNGYVLDLDLLNWIDSSDVQVSTSRFNDLLLAVKSGEIRGTDISRLLTSSSDRKLAKCLTETVKVGSIDTDTIGCIASKIVLYVSLVFIVLIVVIKFILACMFTWFFSWRLGVKYTDKEKDRIKDIEDWADDIYRPAPHIVNANTFNNGRSSRFFPKTSRFTSPYAQNERSRSKTRPTTMASQSLSSTAHLIVPGSLYGQDSSSNFYSSGNSTYHNPIINSSSASLGLGREDYENPRLSTVMAEDESSVGAGYYQDNVVAQPPADYQPFGYPLVHTICLVTAYSESLEGIRTTLDSVATTDYPNSHKLIIAVCDGLVRGAGNDLTTPDMVLSMMTDFVIPLDKVEPFSYVAVASGTKRHNMAKVYAGFYKYDDETVDPAKQQRVPMLTVVKCGPPDEAHSSKPGNRGKRDSQIILMSFFQKVMFDERMTELEYEMFNGIWQICGISPDMYEVTLMVDADTKVYPDSLTHMNACFVHDPYVMGLCGETKIGNKRQSWVTMIQVFEYYVSHHLTKSFESMFGSVTCLPGCFSMYRIKAPKENGYWVPILANPDIVERYSDNVVETLHQKNLMLLGEDRYLTTLMLRTFPKRKQLFVPQAVCKTMAPDTFSVLLSQRRRWINSTVHNLMELTLVNTLCGVFCASMQFVILIELVGTLVLPVALAFTLYVVVIAIVRKPVPIIPLVLLGMILGLPGVLVIITAHRTSYMLWMLIYLLALPVWNFILPMNAYWKFDDFSWGETRQVQGGDKGHDESEGEFDSSMIKMRKWRDWEVEKKQPHFAMPPPQAPYAQATGVWPSEE